MHREFVYAGGPVPKLNEQEHGAFLLLYQKAILASLEKRGLLNHSQLVQCVQKIEEEAKKKPK